MTFYQHKSSIFYVLFFQFIFILQISGNVPVFFNITDCYGIIDNANLKIYGSQGIVECIEGYDLEGTSDVNCLNGHWTPEPRCIPRCYEPPSLGNGTVTTNELRDYQGLYRKGTVATHVCNIGYYLIPPESKLRVCEEGIWTGSEAKCYKHHASMSGCQRPPEVSNGYYVFEKHGHMNPFEVGQRLHYSCREGFILEGSSVQQCRENGNWSPKIQPICWKPTNDRDTPCGMTEFIPHTAATVVKGRKTDDSADPGTIIEIRCLSTFHDEFERRIVASCRPSQVTCTGGRWRWNGIKPNCGPNITCPSPPSVDHATVSTVTGFKGSKSYPVKSQVFYKCLPDYILEGNELLTCLEGGCWFPQSPPICVTNDRYNYTRVNAYMISFVTGTVVSSLLITICLLVYYRQRKRMLRELALPTPIQSADVGDHAILLQQPDRLALIAFAEGQRNSLPTYDEAVRDRPLNYLPSGRLQPRPQWQHITARRSRNSPNSDLLHGGRHGSFVSHTLSTRSAGESMGSTDTVAISENSTNVTLDTVSSHSGSQAPSCRANCGSLASFDAGSAIVTEDIPLLEESDLEEVPVCDTISLMLENPSIQDNNASQKISGSAAEVS